MSTFTPRFGTNVRKKYTIFGPERVGKGGFSQLPRRMFSFPLPVSPSFHGVEEANTICWPTDLDQIFSAHPEEVSTYKATRRKAAERSCPQWNILQYLSFMTTMENMRDKTLFLHFRAPQICSSYLKNPPTSARTWSSQAWMCTVLAVTWEAGEEPGERWEPVAVQPLLSVLRRGRRQKVLHGKKKKKKKKSPWNEDSSIRCLQIMA